NSARWEIPSGLPGLLAALPDADLVVAGTSSSQGRGLMDHSAHRFVRMADSLEYSSLSPEALHAAKRSFVDSFGCALGSFWAPPARALRSLSSQIGAKRPATIIGTTIKTSPDL